MFLLEEFGFAFESSGHSLLKFVKLVFGGFALFEHFAPQSNYFLLLFVGLFFEFKYQCVELIFLFRIKILHSVAYLFKECLFCRGKFLGNSGGIGGVLFRRILIGVLNGEHKFSAEQYRYDSGNQNY